ncbi:hypothetical protein niasHT_028162 [Heterodera trifolii]|uniref:Uncharacterized protein n=1 Tax=Heterodera trifolii TaxID=157864 RepID=A0ABD2JNV8_9BILA
MPQKADNGRKGECAFRRGGGFSSRRRRGHGDGDGLSPQHFGELFLAAVFVHRPSLVSRQPFSSPAGDPLTHRPSAAAGDRCKEWTRRAQKIGMERLSRTDTPSAVPSGRLM